MTLVDRTRAVLARAIDVYRGSGHDQRLVEADQQAAEALTQLPGLRTIVATSTAPAAAVIARYDDLIAAVGQLDAALLRGVNTTEVSSLASALVASESVGSS